MSDAMRQAGALDWRTELSTGMLANLEGGPRGRLPPSVNPAAVRLGSGPCAPPSAGRAGQGGRWGRVRVRADSPQVPKNSCFCVTCMFTSMVLRARTSRAESPLTDVGGHRPVHDVKCFVKFVLDRWVCQHLV